MDYRSIRTIRSTDDIPKRNRQRNSGPIWPILLLVVCIEAFVFGFAVLLYM